MSFSLLHAPPPSTEFQQKSEMTKREGREVNRQREREKKNWHVSSGSYARL